MDPDIALARIALKTGMDPATLVGIPAVMAVAMWTAGRAAHLLIARGGPTSDSARSTVALTAFVIGAATAAGWAAWRMGWI
jgi:hypothetical protein